MPPLRLHWCSRRGYTPAVNASPVVNVRGAARSGMGVTIDTAGLCDQTLTPVRARDKYRRRDTRGSVYSGPRAEIVIALRVWTTPTELLKRTPAAG